MSTCSVAWKNNHIEIIAQQLLHDKTKVEKLTTIEQVRDSITYFKIKGSRAITMASAMGLALWSQAKQSNNLELFLDEFQKQRDYLISSKPASTQMVTATTARIVQKVKKSKKRD